MLFATLFSSDIMGALQRTPLWLRLTGLAGAALAAVVAGRLSQIAVAHAANLGQTRSQPGALPDVIDGTRAIGDLFVGSWLVAFLIAGMLLTAALIGAVAIVRRYRHPPEAPRG